MDKKGLLSKKYFIYYWRITMKEGLNTVGPVGSVGSPISEDKERCHVCISNLPGVGHKMIKNQIYRVKTLGRIFKKHTYKDHLIATCKIC